jgi:hypothetical protein
MIAVDSICWALPAEMGSFGLRGFGFFGGRVGLARGFNRDRGQNSMVMELLLPGYLSCAQFPRGRQVDGARWTENATCGVDSFSDLKR